MAATIVDADTDDEELRAIRGGKGRGILGVGGGAFVRGAGGLCGAGGSSAPSAAHSSFAIDANDWEHGGRVLSLARPHSRPRFCPPHAWRSATHVSAQARI